MCVCVCVWVSVFGSVYYFSSIKSSYGSTSFVLILCRCLEIVWKRSQSYSQDTLESRVHCAIIQAHHKHILMQMRECVCAYVCVGVLVDKQNVIYYKRPREEPPKGKGKPKARAPCRRRLWGTRVAPCETSCRSTAARTWPESESES